VIETVKIGGRGSDRLMARKLSPSNFGLLQQYRHIAAEKLYGGLSGTGESGRCIRMA
jgi:hypothetical protein